jgi:hypothetical protein
MDPAAYDAYTEALLEAVRRDADMLGIILAGSTADASRRDVWSDHDFLLIVKPGLQERYRQDLSWLPDADRIVLRYRETEHGLNVIYEYGHLAEFAVFDPDEVRVMKANDYSVPVDKADIADRMRVVAEQSTPAPLDTAGAAAHCMQLIFVGVGRFARGETLSGHAFVRFWALRRLLMVLPAVLKPEHASRLDTLDPFRRVERALPDLAAQIDGLLRLDVLGCATGILDILDTHVGPHLPGYPVALMGVVRSQIAKAHSAGSATLQIDPDL